MFGTTSFPDKYDGSDFRRQADRYPAFVTAPHESRVPHDVLLWRRYIQHIKTMRWKNTIFTIEEICLQLTDECEHDDHERHVAVTYVGEVDTSVTDSINDQLQTTTGRWVEDDKQGSYLIWVEKTDHPDRQARTKKVWEVKFGRVEDTEQNINVAGEISSPNSPPQQSSRF